MQHTTLVWAGVLLALVILVALFGVSVRRARHERQRREQAELAALAAAQQHAKARLAEREAQQRAADAAAAQATAEREAQAQTQARARAREAEADAWAAAARAAEQLAAEHRLATERDAAAREAAARDAAAREAAEGAHPPQRPRAPEDTLIMVADDSKVVRVKLSRLLAQHRYRVVLAEDGDEAARLIEAEVPLVLITDVEMPGMDGFALARHVRAHPRAGRIPIIMITSADERLRADAASAGVTLVLGKPYPEDALLACIEQAQALAPETTAA